MEKYLKLLKEKYDQLKSIDIEIQNLEIKLIDYRNEVGYRFEAQHRLHEEVERSYKTNYENYF